MSELQWISDFHAEVIVVIGNAVCILWKSPYNGPLGISDCAGFLTIFFCFVFKLTVTDSITASISFDDCISQNFEK